MFHYRRQKDGTYIVFHAGANVGMVRKNRENKFVATSFSKGTSSSVGLLFSKRDEAAQWLVS